MKGAVVNRKSQPSALSNPNHVRMDLDDPRTFPIESGIRQELLQQLNLDADLLEKHNIMDYSLLVGLVLKENQAAEMVVEKEEGDKKKKKSKKKRDKKKRETENKAVTLDSIWRTGLPSASDPNEHYMVGIIDILQDYNTFKKSAHLLKVIIWRHSVRSRSNHRFSGLFIENVVLKLQADHLLRLALFGRMGSRLWQLIFTRNDSRRTWPTTSLLKAPVCKRV